MPVTFMYHAQSTPTRNITRKAQLTQKRTFNSHTRLKAHLPEGARWPVA